MNYYTILKLRRLGIDMYYPALVDNSGRILVRYQNLTRYSETAVRWEVIPKLKGRNNRQVEYNIDDRMKQQKEGFK